jgi:hypothetical protein
MVPAALLVAASLSLTAAPPAHADAPPPAASTVAAGQISIPEGMPVHLTLLKELKSGGNKGGEDVPFEVSKDVYGPGRVLLIAASTPAFGKIQESSRRGIFGKAGKLKFTIDYILAPDKTHIPLRADPQILHGQDNRTTAIATAILLAPIAIFVNGRDVSVKKGEEFTMYVNAPTVAQSPYAPAPAAPAAPATPPVVAPASFAPAALTPATPAQSVFVFANGARAVGTLISFDGSLYTVSTTKGMRKFKTAAIKAVYPVTATPVAAATVGK